MSLFDETMAPEAMADEFQFETIGSKHNDAEEKWEMPSWMLMVLLFLLSGSIAAVAFYLSYRHERAKNEQNSKQRSDAPVEDNRETDDDKMERGLPIKVRSAEAWGCSMKDLRFIPLTFPLVAFLLRNGKVSVEALKRENRHVRLRRVRSKNLPLATTWRTRTTKIGLSVSAAWILALIL
jgi:hypothetical protein